MYEWEIFTIGDNANLRTKSMTKHDHESHHRAVVQTLGITLVPHVAVRSWLRYPVEVHFPGELISLGGSPMKLPWGLLIGTTVQW